MILASEFLYSDFTQALLKFHHERLRDFAINCTVLRPGLTLRERLVIAREYLMTEKSNKAALMDRYCSPQYNSKNEPKYTDYPTSYIPPDRLEKRQLF